MAIRRRLLAAGVVASASVLAGCGLQPLDGRTESISGPARQGLVETEIGWLGERSGQLLRLALQARFQPGSDGGIRHYDLSVTYSIQAEGIAIESTTAPSRLRYIGLLNWTLTARDSQRSTLSSGFARQLDGVNVYNSQYFALDLQGEAVQRRLADALADQVALQLGAYFIQHPPGG